MRLTQYTDYGLRVLMYVSCHRDDTVTTAQLAKVLGVSRHHLLKVVRRLIEQGWLHARRGPTGGVSFAADSGSVTVGEIVRTLETHLDLVECFAPDTNTCPLFPGCRLAPLLHRAQAAFLRELDAVTLQELMQDRIEQE